MTKQMLEENIKTNLVEAYKSGRFYTINGYLTIEGVMIGIAEAMGYEIEVNHFRHGRFSREFVNKDEREKVITIMNGMEKKGLLKLSKNSCMYKLAYAF
ncbi:MAG: hypothetical protein MJ168_08020 [Clostridia bacterium]|nr:hypothetical protein [Clostridia bacterium]